MTRNLIYIQRPLLAALAVAAVLLLSPAGSSAQDVAQQPSTKQPAEAGRLEGPRDAMGPKPLLFQTANVRQQEPSTDCPTSAEGDPRQLRASTCFCPLPATQTASGWAMGHPTCAAAKSACRADAFSKASTFCSTHHGTEVCSTGSITYRPSPSCTYKQSGYMVDCDLEFVCEFCLDVQPL